MNIKMLTVSLTTKLVLIFIAAQNAEAVGDGCDQASDVMGARYMLTSAPQQQEAPGGERVTLWRDRGRVAHQYDGRGETHGWARVASDRLQRMQYFDDRERGIEYEATSTSMDATEIAWQGHWQLIANRHLKLFDLVESTGEGCDRLLSYRRTVGPVSELLEWWPERQLIKRWSRHSAATWRELQLVEILDAEASRKAFGRLDDYALTDFSDIGDHESDPLFLSMIKLGFNTEDGTHSHQH